MRLDGLAYTQQVISTSHSSSMDLSTWKLKNPFSLVDLGAVLDIASYDKSNSYFMWCFLWLSTQ